MSLPPLSPAQRAAVEHAFDDALVTAGAGSGKTRVLSERFVHLVREGSVDLRRLAALTFTEKAAGQMRDRIADLFRRLAARAEGDDAARLRSLRADVEFAPINTIHAFCALLLRQHAIEAGVDPAFQVLDAVEADLLIEDAAEQAENRLAAEDPEGIEVFHALAGESRPQILKLLAQLRGAGVAIDDITWHAGDVDLGAALEQAEAALADWALAGDCLPEERQPNHADAVALAGHVIGALRAGEASVDPFLASQAESAVAGMKGPTVRAYSTPRKALETALATVRAAVLDAWAPEVLLPRLRHVLAAYDDAYRRLKHERSALDFTDLELRARDLLRQAQARERPLDLAPRGLLVDEFQDTNPLQAEILSLLRSHAPQFSVGDPKQSIYRFRGADVGVILSERERVGEDAVHPMNASYRACRPLVAAINAVNTRLFAPDAAGRDAAGVIYEPLEAAATYLPTVDPRLEVTVIDVGKEGSADDARAVEAAWIARRIRLLVDARTPRLRPDADDPTQSKGPVGYGDIAILFRAAGDLATYEAALQAEGIPFLTQKSKGFFQADEITDLLHVLRAVHNPEDRFALACMATGPAMAATDGEILRWFGPGEGTPWQRMQADAAAGGRHAATVATLRELRVDAAGGALAAAVERALVEFGVYETALLMPVGDRRAANLRKAVDLARRLDRGGRRGLADLLRHLQTLRDRAAGEAEAPIGGEADDVVRLTTVHGAKGLEYPVVFVADIGRKPGGGGPPPIQFDGTTGIAAKVTDPLEGRGCAPAGHEAITADEKVAEAEEALRVLYVAMTRAEEHLFLTGWCKGITGRGAARKPSRFLGWGADLWKGIAGPVEHGVHDLVLDEADVRVHFLEAADVDLPPPVDTAVAVASVTPDARAEAERLWSDAAQSVAPLGDTRYVVSVSELLTFAESPQRYYTDRVVFGGARVAAAAAWDAPPSEMDDAPGEGSEAGRRADAVEAWDETPEQHAGLDRAALGRAVHAVIEHLGEGPDVPQGVLEQAVEAELGDRAPDAEAFAAAARGMVERFLAGPTGVALRAALAAGEDVRREVALHARIRFPGGEPVGGFDSLLVKGSIDLWLPSDDGVWIVDHKTNRAGALYKTPEALAAHYDWQLRLYALAVERVLGADVAGARLVLLDPGWGAEAVEVEVDVAGDKLEEARALCRAFAVAELEGRYPADWRSLLA